MSGGLFGTISLLTDDPLADATCTDLLLKLETVTEKKKHELAQTSNSYQLMFSRLIKADRTAEFAGRSNLRLLVGRGNAKLLDPSSTCNIRAQQCDAGFYPPDK
ncbi:hypothetical protein DPMN_056635 [Dreissena polymorpha]|uniref:Uncharacterized protein n=1 Tax=Dreissena polymorpha TaxID=45954 RepID=A0A9D4HTD4_DREPO|nr:hypothetical protein DPMN_056635 [Dreissena polymorpha]